MKLRDLGAGVLVVLLVIVLFVGGWLGYWWLAKDSRNRDADIRRHSFEQQTTYRDEAARKIADVATVDAQLADPALPADQRAALTAQRAAMVTATCAVISHLSGDTSLSVTTFNATNC